MATPRAAVPRFVSGLYDILQTQTDCDPKKRYPLFFDTPDGCLVGVDALCAALVGAPENESGADNKSKYLRHKLRTFLREECSSVIRSPIETKKRVDAHGSRKTSNQCILAENAERFVVALSLQKRFSAQARAILEAGAKTVRTWTCDACSGTEMQRCDTRARDAKCVYVKQIKCGTDNGKRLRILHDEGKDRSEVLLDLTVRDERFWKVTQWASLMIKRDPRFLEDLFEKQSAALSMLHNVVASVCYVQCPRIGDGICNDVCSLSAPLPEPESSEWLNHTHVNTILCVLNSSICRMNFLKRKQARLIPVSSGCPGAEVSAAMTEFVKNCARRDNSTWPCTFTTRAWAYNNAPSLHHIEECGLLECLEPEEKREHVAYRKCMKNRPTFLHLMAPREIDPTISPLITRSHVALAKIYWCVLRAVPPDAAGLHSDLCKEMIRYVDADIAPFVAAAKLETGLETMMPAKQRVIFYMKRTIIAVVSLLKDLPQAGHGFIVKTCGLVQPPTSWLRFSERKHLF